VRRKARLNNLSEMLTAEGIRQGLYRSETVRRFAQWLDVARHPLTACEIAGGYIAAARWNRAGDGVESLAVEPLPPGAIKPSAVDTNVTNPAEVRSALEKVFARVHAKTRDVALFLPDPVIRVFILHFDVFPRAVNEALPLLRWRVKKSVPFEADETVISYMRQAPREDGVDVVTAVARLRVVREYEQLLESLGVSPGVVMSSTLAALPLLNDRKPALLARVAGKSMTAAIVREGLLCGYRCVELPADETEITPQALLDEIYPLTAYYQDSWHEGISMVGLAGLAGRIDEFREPLERELRCPVGGLLSAAASEGHIRSELRPLVERELDALVGWTLYRGS
jgi:type IV pilus assembly protein PilM